MLFHPSNVFPAKLVWYIFNLHFLLFHCLWEYWLLAKKHIHNCLLLHLTPSFNFLFVCRFTVLGNSWCSVSVFCFPIAVNICVRMVFMILSWNSLYIYFPVYSTRLNVSQRQGVYSAYHSICSVLGSPSSLLNGWINGWMNNFLTKESIHFIGQWFSIEDGAGMLKTSVCCSESLCCFFILLQSVSRIIPLRFLVCVVRSQGCSWECVRRVKHILQ